MKFKLYNEHSKEHQDPYWEIIRSRHPFEPDRDPLNSIPCMHAYQDLRADWTPVSVTVIDRTPPSLGTHGLYTHV